MIGDRTDRLREWDVTHSYDDGAERPSEVIPRAVAGTTNRGVCSIAPLYESVEPDAIDSLLSGNGRNSVTWITFHYEGCQVYADGERVSVSCLDEDAPD